MRVNIYAEETTPFVEIIEKKTENGTFTGLRFWLHLPVTERQGASGEIIQHQGPFMHHPGDDDSSAVTFWGKKDMRINFRKALELLDKHYEARDKAEELRKSYLQHHGHNRHIDVV